MNYELRIFEVDYRGTTITDRTVKKTNDPKLLEELEEYAKNYYSDSESSKISKDTFYLKFVIYENQDNILFNYQIQIKSTNNIEP